ncbi:glycosyltransferase [Actinoplanes sp. SE50]|uniref:phospholipid carrier-dependent glycosyltransferase n=1 Tax=unclassified Actinoplanes TaxID=2626549 RepID=UPI00023ED6CF|nr:MULTISPECIES: phospholipid carrier-dependent glycosyltransferase [unclassified Actinoplanes]AEV87913.1 Dolichyl-phosphate-mannose-protein mannosyltransferase 1 [Actinoplanes sp. SE50/110]ATO86317.1 glycosyltransferase [Actinoplanes sp. SE50]SLM03732.1 glycosyl transferase [Actinoplanes sp. SE50/110]
MPRRRLLFLLAVVAMLGQMAFAMVTTATQLTPTIDEPVYVATAEVYTQQHSLRYNFEHPPLGKLIMATGLAFGGAHRLDPAYPGDQSALGRNLLYESGNNPFRLLLAARVPIIVLTLLFGLVVLAFARDVAGPWAALIALALYSFDPDVIAHGSLATLDVPAAGLLLTAFWLAWRGRERAYRYLPLAGVALGAALATRASALPAVPLIALLCGWSMWRAQRSASRRRRLVAGALAAAGVGLIAVAVVWVVYLAVDPHLRWTTPDYLAHPDGLRAAAVQWLPLPQAYRDGLLLQFRLEARTYNGFLLGQAYRGNLWYYLPVALLIKTPLGMLVLWIAGALTMILVPRLRAAAVYVLPVSALLLLVAMTGSRDYGTRYAIFLPMFLAVAAGTVALIRIRRVPWVTAALILFVAISSVRTFPYYLPYSNEAFGGTADTHRNLHDSNVDWGQDLARLAQKLRTDYPGEPVWLVYKGSGVPAYYGINATDPYGVPEDRVHGLLVVSDSRVALAGVKLQRLIDTSRAIDQVGYAMTIYRR